MAAFIFNLGHRILSDPFITHVERLLARCGAVSASVIAGRRGS
jgi:hypothetical protein